MAIGSNPLSSTRTFARIDLISLAPNCLEISLARGGLSVALGLALAFATPAVIEAQAPRHGLRILKRNCSRSLAAGTTTNAIP
jgi:hypothetical protein